MEKLKEYAKKLLELNPESSITGSLMLKLRGFDIDREVNDIDILFPDYAGNFIFPNEWISSGMEHVKGSGFHNIAYTYDNIKIDILATSEPYEIVDGFRLAKPELLVIAKMVYANQKIPQAEKHRKDLLNMGYTEYEINNMIDTIFAKDDKFELPF